MTIIMYLFEFNITTKIEHLVNYFKLMDDVIHDF